MCTTANTTRPLSYSKVCDTFRPRIGHGAAIRTDLGRKAFVDFLEPRAMLNSLVRQLMLEARPASIQDRLGHAGPGESGGGNITDRNIVELPDDKVRQLVRKIVATVRNLCVDRPDAPLLVGALRQRENLLGATIDTLRFDLFAGRKRREVFQAKVDTDTAQRLTSMGSGRDQIDHDIQVPVPSRVARKVGATQCILLPIVAVIPDEVARARLPVKQPVQGLHPVTIHKNHAVIIGSVFSNRKASIAAQSAAFLPTLKGGVSRST